MFNWNYLETFVILSENLSFSETAKVLNTAQPAISRQIRLLEDSLGYPLFIRSRKSVVLSKEGQQLKVQLAPLVEEIKKLFFERQAVGSLLSGAIRIGSMQEAGQILLMPKISQFLRIHPDLDIHTTFMSSNQVSEAVLKGSLDFGFVYRLPESKTLRAYALTEDCPVLIQSAKSKVPLAARKTLEFVGYREDDLYAKEFLSRILAKSEQKKVRFRSSVNSHSAMVQLVLEEDLLAVLPKNSALRALEKNKIKVVTEDAKTHPLHLICHEQMLVDKKKKIFRDFLMKEFRAK
ncbi:LysR family transcriptional regulator [Bdellovibrio svalbardensis]|uniref:LysR family transcriptional regulator n=1 Tax=Bdellovibrio svalbardensis TaxID=2972972 RepID=A0ABT6DGF3_9BACT|nr:LysR family transcriptional regulator [Bdellovibrio svalbardensis]MDG0815330.1 LysR family transcriptional regulator [Bdellovibrio svalbardensis]